MHISPIGKEILNNPSELRYVCASIAKLHCESSPDDLSAQFGETAMSDLIYPGIAASPSAVVLILWNERKIVGFVAAVKSMKKCMQKIVMAHPIKSIQYAMRSFVFNPGQIRDVLSALVLLKAPLVQEPLAEIFMISVSIQHRGKGMGRRLLSALYEESAQHNIKTCLARVQQNNEKALAMYRACGYHDIGSVVFRGAQWKWMAFDLPQRQTTNTS